MKNHLVIHNWHLWPECPR